MNGSLPGIKKLRNEKATEELGFKVGSRLRGGEIIELISDLGGGKTTFVRGLARGAGSKEHVTSPTFTIRNDYKAGKIKIAHFDFFRLDNDPGILSDLLAEAISDPDSVVVIEWADVLHGVLPREHVKLELSVTGYQERIARVFYPAELDYLFNGVFLSA